MEPERQAFLAAFKANPTDYIAHRAFSDWLEERGEHEEAERHRAFEEADVWMRTFSSRLGETITNYSEVWSEYFDRTRHIDHLSSRHQEIQDECENRQIHVTITYELVLEVTQHYVNTWEEEGGYGSGETFTQFGSETARDLLYEPETRAAFWKNWQIITEKFIPDKITQDGVVFGCSC